MTANNILTTIPVIIIAGGQSRRLRLGKYQRKWQLPLGDATLLEHMIDIASSISTIVAINGSYKDARQFSHLPFPYISDREQKGPLSGILNALNWGKKNQYNAIITLPCDTPFIPIEWIFYLYKQFLRSESSAIFSQSKHGLHPLCGVWSTQLTEDLEAFMQSDKKKAVHLWAKQHATIVDYEGYQSDPEHTHNTFMNINTLAEYEAARKIINELD